MNSSWDEISRVFIYVFIYLFRFLLFKVGLHVVKNFLTTKYQQNKKV